jgi:voltage-gated potassium channel
VSIGAEELHAAEHHQAERGKAKTRAASLLAWRPFMIALALASLAIGAMPIVKTEPDLAADAQIILAIQLIAGLIFLADYVAHLWLAYDAPGSKDSPAERVWRYVGSTTGVIDLLSLVAVAGPVSGALTDDAALLFECVPMLKPLRYFAALDTLAAVLRRESRVLIAGFLILLILLLFLSVAAYLIERAAQPDKFGTVAEAAWWGIATLSSVGYGDSVPVTPLGKLLGGVAVIVGIGIFALPTGILATGFAEELRRRSFVVTWNLVAAVPFFQRLPAIVIAELAAKLEPLTVKRGELLIVQGEHADAMYFLIEGEVDVLVSGTRIQRLHVGDFFGEIALLEDVTRTASVAAATFCRVLRLRRDEFKSVIRTHPELGDIAAKVARERRSAVKKAAEDTPPSD